MNKELKYIAVEGVIGAGKTSLAKKLKERLDAQIVLEEFEANPFLGEFYNDRKRYAFQTQMFFLVNRYKQQQQLNQENLFSEYLITDYIFEKDQIFAYLNLNGEELKLYETLFPMLNRNIRKPDLVVFLQSSIERLMFNIKKRSRHIERNIVQSYIEELSEAYNDFFFKYSSTPLLIVDATEIDFIKSQKDFDELYQAIFRDDRGIIEYFQPEVRRIF